MELLEHRHAQREAYLTKDRRQILFRMLGARSKSHMGGLIFAISSSSCMVDVKTFNNNDCSGVTKY